MYEGTRSELITRNQRPIERDMIKYCVKKLSYEEWSQLLDPKKLKNLLSIKPIFKERDWLREDWMNTREFDLLVETTERPLTGRADEDVSSFEALLDLLYVVRCNRHHGFKTPDRPRDREVLDATVPLLRELVTKLATHFNV